MVIRKRLTLLLIAVCSLGTLQLVLPPRGQAESARVLVDLAKEFDRGSIKTTDATISLTARGRLLVVTGRQARWPGVTVKAPAGKWDLSRYLYLAVDVRNTGTRSTTLHCRVDNPGADGRHNCLTDRLTLSPNTSGTLIVYLSKTSTRLTAPLELIGMRASPEANNNLDPANVTQILFFVSNPSGRYKFEIANVRAGGEVTTLDAKRFFPFIDEFGQYIHKDWPGKIHTEKDFKARQSKEEKDLSDHFGPSGRDEYGGWLAGPKLEPTGFFQVIKYKNKWWLVDPEGRLFWSHGIDCVNVRGSTPITDREHYFRNLPKSNSPFARFYGSGAWAAHGYYRSRSPYKTYDFFRANLLRKYNKNWRRDFAEISHRRLRSWGMNTIANWSDASIYMMRKTPYVATINYSARPLEGSQGYWKKFYDVFDPSFRDGLRKRMRAEIRRSAGDPWCIGYFVDNELSWGNDTSLALATLRSPADQPAKKVFINDLKSKYKSIERLNDAWNTGYPAWGAILKSTYTPDSNKARSDLTDFYRKTAETYFRTIREEVKKVAPHQLYLGCRFAWVNDLAATVAAKYCDVVSFNQYKYSVEQLHLPGKIDKPIIIGEFHFGALDRGMFHTGLRRTLDQEDRAAKYMNYVQGALRNPYIVGTHWFQYKDQPTTGRSDGENYQIGFVDICDTPYPEIVKASRRVGYGMYEYRLRNYTSLDN